MRHLEKGRVVIFGAGVGMPYFSTDTTAAQRALEIGAEVRADGQGASTACTTPIRAIDPDAKMFDEITHREVLEQGLKVADATAFSLCMDNDMPIIVFNLLTEGNIARAVRGEKIGTLVYTPTPDRTQWTLRGRPMIDETLFDAEEKMEKAVAVAKDDLASVRTGRANPNMFARIVVDYYGAMTPLNQLAIDQHPRGPDGDHQAVRRRPAAGHREGDPRLRPRASTRATTGRSSASSSRS